MVSMILRKLRTAILWSRKSLKYQIKGNILHNFSFFLSGNRRIDKTKVVNS